MPERHIVQIAKSLTSQREHFSRISEGDWTFSRAVPSGEDVDEQGDQANSDCAFVFRNQEAETSSQERPGHLGKCEKK